jgi:hypothetical protein
MEGFIYMACMIDDSDVDIQLSLQRLQKDYKSFDTNITNLPHHLPIYLPTKLTIYHLPTYLWNKHVK